MVDVDDHGMQAVLDRLTRLEERGIARDERAERMERSIAELVRAVNSLSDDMKAAKTALSIGGMISRVFYAVGGGGIVWILNHFQGK